jgi:hypothetical protein
MKVGAEFMSLLSYVIATLVLKLAIPKALEPVSE